MNNGSGYGWLKGNNHPASKPVRTSLGVFASMNKAAKAFGISCEAMSQRIDRGEYWERPDFGLIAPVIKRKRKDSARISEKSQEPRKNRAKSDPEPENGDLK